jgi:hypothetical protein
MEAIAKRDAASFERSAVGRSTIARPTMIVIAAIGLAAIAGCASTGERPDAQLATAQANIEQAQQAGANQHAAQPLSSAREKLSAAQAAVSRDEMIVAERLAEEAALDAELASAMARNRKAELAVEELNETIEVLRDEIARGQSPTGEMR